MPVRFRFPTTPVRQLLLYSLSLALLLFLLQWLEWQLLIRKNASDLYIGSIALLFTLLGIWLARQLTRPRIKTVIVEKTVFVQSATLFQPDESAIRQYRLSQRELEVLDALNRGLSNEDIAAELFLSVSTVKTHASNLFAKLEVRSRTQAIQRAKQIRLLP